MDGGLIWVVIVIGWILFSIFGKSDEEKTYEARKEIFDKIRLQLKVSEEIPPKEKGLPDVKCIVVKVMGLFGNPNDSKTKLFLLFMITQTWGMMSSVFPYYLHTLHFRNQAVEFLL